MRQIWIWLTTAAAATVLWTALLSAELSPAQRQVVTILPLYALISLGCYGLGMLGYGVMVFPDCPEESALLQKDIREAQDFLRARGVDVGPVAASSAAAPAQ